jgi:ankyrin repeat protein
MNLVSMLAMLFTQVSADEPAQLFDAIRKGDALQLQSLLSANPKLAKAANRDGATAVLWAAYTRHPELAAMLLGSREPGFFEACALGMRDRVALLLRQDPSLAAAFSDDGFGGLGLAIFFGHFEIARILVDAGADVNSPSRNAIRVAPLHSAVASGSVAILELLLAHGARPDPVELLETTPLHSAAGHGSREMVEQLLAAGADPHRKTKDGQTPADLARQHGHHELATELAPGGPLAGPR